MSEPLKLRRSRIASLELLRIVLASLVFFQHISTFVWRHGLTNPLTSIVGVTGDAAVLSFIQLSGFLTILRYPEFEKKTNLKYKFDYLTNRALRIWPEYLLSLIAAGTILLASNGKLSLINSTPLNIRALLQQLSLTHAWPNLSLSGPGWNGVTWSLSIEWLLYLLTPLLIPIIFRVFKSGMSLVVIATLVAVVLIDIVHPPFPTTYNLFLKCAANYLIGMGCGFYVGKNWNSSRRMFSKFGIFIGLCAFPLQKICGETFAYLIILGSVLILLGSFQDQHKFTDDKIFWVGSNAFGFFLWHSILLLVVDWFFPNLKVANHLGEMLIAILVGICSLTLADLGRRVGDFARTSVNRQF